MARLGRAGGKATFSASCEVEVKVERISDSFPLSLDLLNRSVRWREQKRGHSELLWADARSRVKKMGSPSCVFCARGYRKRFPTPLFDLLPCTTLSFATLLRLCADAPRPLCFPPYFKKQISERHAHRRSEPFSEPHFSTPIVTRRLLPQNKRANAAGREWLYFGEGSARPSIQDAFAESEKPSGLN